MNQQELKNILYLHRKWVIGENGGVRANLSSADLSFANLRFADLSFANLSSADLSFADLSYANLNSANLSSANLSSADLSSANLSFADLSFADLSSANLSSANFSSANLRYANLSSANLRYANLRSANLSSADLRYANLGSADLSFANLRFANLRFANLSSADLSSITDDFYKKLLIAKKEAIGLYDALKSGKVDGSCYQGECACFIGTIANIRGEHHEKLKIDLRPDADSPTEKWFMGISQGDTPESNQVSKITCEWMEKWAQENGVTLPKYRLISSIEKPEMFA